MTKETKGFSEILKGIWKGEFFPTEKQKYRAISFGLGLIHILLVIYFFVIGYGIIAVYNVFSSIYYLTAAVSISDKNNYYGIFTGAFIEIVFFSAVISLLCGWKFGFGLYMIALAPVSFFICYSSAKNTKRNLTLPAVFSILYQINSALFIPKMSKKNLS